MSLPTIITGVRRVDGKATVTTIPLPVIDADSVLIKIVAAPINPGDVAWVRGIHSVGKDKDAFAGFEGMGVVTSTGNSEAAASFAGKRVSFFAAAGDQGSWADYAVIKAAALVALPDAIDDEQGATALVNPLTVELFLVECEKAGHKAIVHNAAASALGQQLVSAAKKEGKVSILNLVRRRENVETLKKLGAEHVIDTTVDGWEEEFKALCTTLKPSAYFDPVAGSAGSKIITLMPDEATIYTYGTLSESSAYTFPAEAILLQHKTIRSMLLVKELRDPEVAKAVFTNAIANLVAKTYQTTIHKRYPQSQFEAAIKDYEANASKGKILLVPDSI